MRSGTRAGKMRHQAEIATVTRSCSCPLPDENDLLVWTPMPGRLVKRARTIMQIAGERLLLFLGGLFFASIRFVDGT